MSEQYPPQYPGQYPGQYPDPSHPQTPYQGGSYPPPPPPPYQQQPSGYMPNPGYPMAPGYAPVGVAAAGASKLAIASLVCGIVGLCTGFASIAAVICGHMALSQIKKSGGILQGRGMAIAGLVLGYIEIAFIIVYIVIIVAAASTGNAPAQ